MSSFIINKREYIKAAGLVCGVASCSKYGGNPVFCANVKKKFERIYKLNVYSWCQQYHEDITEDTCDYEGVFNEYKSLGRRIYMGLESKMSLDILCCCLINFFRSATYQIENEDANMEASSYFYTCIEMLFERNTNDIKGFWGSIDI